MIKKKLQVFVSSTYNDLISERQAAVSAILKAGHIPAGMELFTSGDVSQMEVIRRWIDESDVYMLILGGRYGSVEPYTGMGYTELEFDYAIEQKKPLFSVVISKDALDEKVKKDGVRVIEQDNPQALALFREKVLRNISAFFKEDKDIKLCVYESLSEFSTSRDLVGWVRASEVDEFEIVKAELRRLRDENDMLRTSTALVAAPTNGKLLSDSEYEELIIVLSSINVSLPEGIWPKSAERSRTLQDIFVNYKDNLIQGVYNTAGLTDFSKFLYFNVAPKLQVHGLITSEPVEGVAYRRAFVSEKGQEFLRRYQVEKAKKSKAKMV